MVEHFKMNALAGLHLGGEGGNSPPPGPRFAPPPLPMITLGISYFESETTRVVSVKF